MEVVATRVTSNVIQTVDIEITFCAKLKALSDTFFSFKNHYCSARLLTNNGKKSMIAQQDSELIISLVVTKGKKKQNRSNESLKGIGNIFLTNNLTIHIFKNKKGEIGFSETERPDTSYNPDSSDKL